MYRLAPTQARIQFKQAAKQIKFNGKIKCKKFRVKMLSTNNKLQKII